jgi:hypothetical protein
MHRIGQLQPVAAEDGGNRLFFLRCSKTISVANCFPPASPILHSGPRKQKAPRRALLKCLLSFSQIGAGEEIRTLDPNLGKVMLYP